MPERAESEITRCLARLASGKAERAAELLPLVYDELRRLARARMAREKPGRTLQATELVHEARLRIAGQGDPGWNLRPRFVAAHKPDRRCRGRSPPPGC